MAHVIPGEPVHRDGDWAACGHVTELAITFGGPFNADCQLCNQGIQKIQPDMCLSSPGNMSGSKNASWASDRVMMDNCIVLM
jgi:hypothetical protein